MDPISKHFAASYVAAPWYEWMYKFSFEKDPKKYIIGRIRSIIAYDRAYKDLK